MTDADALAFTRRPNRQQAQAAAEELARRLAKAMAAFACDPRDESDWWRFAIMLHAHHSKPLHIAATLLNPEQLEDLPAVAGTLPRRVRIALYLAIAHVPECGIKTPMTPTTARSGRTRKVEEYIKEAAGAVLDERDRHGTLEPGTVSRILREIRDKYRPSRRNPSAKPVPKLETLRKQLARHLRELDGIPSEIEPTWQAFRLWRPVVDDLAERAALILLAQD